MAAAPLAASADAQTLKHAQVRQASQAAAGASAADAKVKASHAALLFQRRIKTMDKDRQQHLRSLIEHDANWTIHRWDDLDTMDHHQLRELVPLVKHDAAWIGERWDDIREMDDWALEILLPLLQDHQEWMSKHWDDLAEIPTYRLEYLGPLLQQDSAWATEHWDDLKPMDGGEWEAITQLLGHDREWTSRHWGDLRDLGADPLKQIVPLCLHDAAWTSDHWGELKEMPAHQLRDLLQPLRANRTWTGDHLEDIKAMRPSELRDFAALAGLKLMDDATDNFHSAVNPYVRHALSAKQDRNLAGLFKATPGTVDLADALAPIGASRSTRAPRLAIASALTERFKHNCRQIPAATFGVENEMFIPGIADWSGLEVDALRAQLGETDYAYVPDVSLFSRSPFVHLPVEQVTSILSTPEDVQRLQGALSILNDWGAFSNGSAGVHIHMGIKQWKAADRLHSAEEKSRNAFLSDWDRTVKKFPEITPYQLLVMKQFLVSMVAMQGDFYHVARASYHSNPNGPREGNDLDSYYHDISRARDYDELLSLANVDMRSVNVNLLAYEKHGTIEVRGFTKKNSDTMEVDPNLPVRDLIFMQDVLIKTLNDTKAILLSGASPETAIELRPSEGMAGVVKEYAQHVFQLEIIHALGQRNPEKRRQTMEAILKNKELIEPESLRKIRGSQDSRPEADALAQHFLSALAGEDQWHPASFEHKPLRRSASLRTMADDLGLAGRHPPSPR